MTSEAHVALSNVAGYFGEFGGRYVPEALIPALDELTTAFTEAMSDPGFQADFDDLATTFSGRPTPLTFAGNLSNTLGGARLYLKNEGLNVTGAHKITHCLGQALLAKRLGKTRLIAETGAGQHGVATATVAARLGFECVVYMGEVDIDRQRPNVFLMQQLGATVVPVPYGSRTLKDAVNAAIKDWITHAEDSHYLLGSALGPHPYPAMVQHFQSVVSREIRSQSLAQIGRLPDVVMACVGGGSNAVGAFSDFVNESSVELIGVEAGGRGTARMGDHAARFPSGMTGIFEGYKSIFLQNDDGQLSTTHSISAGLDYPGISPILADLKARGRIQFVSASDAEVLSAFTLVAQHEGIIASLESSHALAHAIALAPTRPRDQIIVVNVSGRGDKDLFILAHAMRDAGFRDFLTTEITRYDE